jgi:hypothetical protein
MSNGFYPGTPFAESHRRFDAIVDRLRSSDTGKMDHGQLENLLSSDGREMIRQLMQDHLDLRHSREPHLRGVEGSDGVLRTHARERKRTLVGIFGPVVVERFAYSAPETEQLCPADAQLNLPPERHSQGIALRISEEAARGSFEEAVKAVERATGVTVPKRQAEQLAQRAASDFEAFYTSRAALGPEPTQDLLVITMDGKGVVMRKEALREETRQEAERREKAGVASHDERQGRKRMATVAAVYSIAPHRRTAEDVMGSLDAGGKPEPKAASTDQERPHSQNKRVWASIADTPEHVTREVFREALRRDPEKKRHWVGLVDGDPHQIERIRAQSRKAHVDVTMVLDFIHVLEYLWNVARVFHGDDHSAAEIWVRERAIKILEGRTWDVAAGIRRSATLKDLRGQARKTVDTSVEYLLNHVHMMQYHEYLKSGLPIASGVIEGACRHLIKDRMDITGARWGLKGAEAVLRLRSLRSSGDFEEYWNFHQHHELVRNHETRFSCAGRKRKAG